MKRSTRSELARKTVEIVERGSYRSASGHPVEIADSVRTLTGVARLLSRAEGPVAALNFASAKNPGGGFLNGSQAQEESLARSSALHASQLRAWEFYERHRASPSLLYSDAMIVSPACPIIRDDEGALLDEPQQATIITSAAPNAGAAANNRPGELPLIPGVLARRSSTCWRWRCRMVTGTWCWAPGAAASSATALPWSPPPLPAISAERKGCPFVAKSRSSFGMDLYSSCLIP